MYPLPWGGGKGFYAQEAGASGISGKAGGQTKAENVIC